MGNDTLRVGDRDVPLEEIEAAVSAAERELDSKPIANYEWSRLSAAILFTRELVAEVRRLRAVEAGGTDA